MRFLIINVCFRGGGGRRNEGGRESKGKMEKKQTKKPNKRTHDEED